MVDITGDGNNNTLDGTGDADNIFGLGGDDTINGAAGADYIEGGDGIDTINGGGGADTILITDYDDIVDGGLNTDSVIIDFSAFTSAIGLFQFAANAGGPWSYGGGGTINAVENVTILLSGNDDTIAADTSSLALTINGNGGNDQIYGGMAADILSGGAGNDVLTSGGVVQVSIGDSLFGNGGDDTLRLSSEGSADGGAGVDGLILYSNGAAAGTSLNFTAMWSGGSVAYGSGVLTAIEMVQFFNGTAFNDVLVIGDGQQLHEGFSQSYYGNDGNDVLIGGINSESLDGGIGNDVLSAGAGNDWLYGGAGTDDLIGGTGDDNYHFPEVIESIVEYAGEGIDTVHLSSSVTAYNLSANVENLIVTSATATLGVGNVEDNVITGNLRRDQLYGREGNDTLNDGGGTTGNEDTLLGGTGNDIYIIRVRGTSTVEYAGEGIDEVQTDFSVYGLQANVENLRVIDTNSSHAALVGNEISNTIRGGTNSDGIYAREGDDNLFGGTGAANTLLGQQGNDNYWIQANGDSVIEFVGEGTDTVWAEVSSFVLPANVENLTYNSNTAFTGVGNELANIIRGGSAADSLNGMDGNDTILSGSGADLLQGGNGSDTFQYGGNETGIDRILDFTSGQDKIALLGSFFTPTGTVSFVQGAGATANSANSTFIYDSTTGIVSYDDDGNGAGAAVQIAQLNAGLTLAAGDFIFY